FSYYLFADKIKQPIQTKKLVPACLLAWEKGSDYIVLVDKSRQKVIVYSKDDLFNPYKVFNCSTGENKGPKQKKNDRKTPEGIYYFTDSIEDKDLSPIYGSHALPINYPNIIDNREGKKGYGIWFHGINKVLKPNDTKGCIAMDNRDIEELVKLVTLFETPVIIGSSLELVSEDQVKNNRNILTDIIEEWRDSWESKDIDRYMSYYSRKFKSGWRKWPNWKEYKTRLAEKYAGFDVEVNDLSLIHHNGIIVASFEQVYKTPNFDSYGEKRLYLTQNSTEWKIIGETYSGKNIPKTAKIKELPFNKQEIKDFISAWEKVWEKKDLSAYISCYDKDFTSRDMTLDEWKSHRNRLNKKYRTIRVDIKNLKIEPLSSGKMANVTFTQDYEADSYMDRGKKEILLVRKGKDWKIREENWNPIKK
ncbi:L,D-transpeptidase family protein, partial [Thermodesulfobacteriota bacterium]